MLILIDGPEKAGKTTLIEYCRKEFSALGYNVHVVKQGPWDPDDSIISADVKKHAQDRNIVYIWDRGWPSEEVYATLLNRKRRANNNPFLMEWLHGRATPYKFILLPSDVQYTIDRRDKSDLPVDPYNEVVLFRAYNKFGYYVMYNSYDHQSLTMNFWRIHNHVTTHTPQPYVYGNPNSKFWFVASLNEGCKGDRWMPLSYSAAYDMFKAVLGNKSLDCAFMFARHGNPALLSADKIVTAVGKEAAEWVRYYASPAVYPNLHRLKKYDASAFQTHLVSIKEQMQ
jgi:hypothetical protein